jgi:pyruvate/2-oxoglutarate dehydrogenase complex dihydrolipoamide dehydrogenase (E3) component
MMQFQSAEWTWLSRLNFIRFWITPMDYDLIIIGETLHAREEAVRAARENRLVAIVRGPSDAIRLFDVPVDQLDWSPPRDWRLLRERFRRQQLQSTTELAHWGIDLFEGEILSRDGHSVSIRDSTGKIHSLEFESVREAELVERRDIPEWLRAEVPRILSLNCLAQRKVLPARILIEGSDLASFRAAVVLSRLGRRVVLISHEFGTRTDNSEGTELRTEALARGVEIIPQTDVLCVQERGGKQFEFCLNDGRVLLTDLYVYATEPVAPEFDEQRSSGIPSEPSRQLATS